MSDETAAAATTSTTSTDQPVLLKLRTNIKKQFNNLTKQKSDVGANTAEKAPGNAEPVEALDENDTVAGGDSDLANNTLKLQEIQDSFVDGLSLVKEGRFLVKEGSLVKICRKQPKTRYVALFNDIFLYATIMKLPSTTVKLALAQGRIIPLNELVVTVIDDSKIKHGFQLSTPMKSFQVFAESDEERTKWLDALKTYIPPSNSSLTTATVWLPDNTAEECMVCKIEKFSLISRRHHCRQCGKVVCGKCSNYKKKLPNLPKPVRVCYVCAEAPNPADKKFEEKLNSLDQKQQVLAEFSDDDSDNDNPEEPDAKMEIKDGTVVFQPEKVVTSSRSSSTPPSGGGRRRQFKKESPTPMEAESTGIEKALETTTISTSATEKGEATATSPTTATVTTPKDDSPPASASGGGGGGGGRRRKFKTEQSQPEQESAGTEDNTN